MKEDQESFQLFELFDSLEDVMVWVKERNGQYFWVNRAFLINFVLENPGGGPEESRRAILGKTDYELSPAFLADQFRLDDEHVLAGNRIVNRIELVGPSAQTAGWSVTNKIPFRDARGKIIGTAGMTRRLNPSDQEIAPGSGFGPVLACLRDDYRKVITNRQLARLANMSVRAFERKFYTSFHLTPQKYLRRLRLRIASRTLVYTRQSLVEVALACGFADQSHFTREFKRHFGWTPRAYREHYAHEIGAAASGLKTAASRQ
jgi:AraC-like DNA-binding protein